MGGQRESRTSGVAFPARWGAEHRALCVDGVVVAEDTQKGLEASAAGLYIGVGNNYAPESFFSGLIDDVRIYNRAVSP